ncbi:MAG: PASTA domain-containing protein, partial [Gemmatimonadaceae bacterium]|nr:PASTA domain-containing protein [Gemmatimonadaceae bacterium]
GTYVMQWPARGAAPPARARTAAVPVPDVRGLSLREAARALHAAGFRVALGTTEQHGTAPAAGTLLRQGATVRLGGAP